MALSKHCDYLIKKAIKEKYEENLKVEFKIYGCQSFFDIRK